jgi:hypothetical protein
MISNERPTRDRRITLCFFKSQRSAPPFFAAAALRRQGLLSPVTVEN